MPNPNDPTLQAQLAEHLAQWFANTPPCPDARTLANALLDPARRGPLVDAEFVTGLVARVDQLKRWPATETRERPEHTGRSLHIVRHPQRPHGTNEFTVDIE